MKKEAKRTGFKVIKNLTGHGVVAIETFISTRSTIANTMNDGWTLTGNKGGYVTQHEHIVMITGGKPIVLTEMNEIWDV